MKQVIINRMFPSYYTYNSTCNGMTPCCLTCTAEEPSCFPGETMIIKEDGQRTQMKDLQEGDRVLVDSEGSFESIIGFLHKVEPPARQAQSVLKIEHDHGILRVSGNHMLFVGGRTCDELGESVQASDMEVGDWFVLPSVSERERCKRSRVLAVEHDATASGLYAPLTSSGKIVVDGVQASNYASVPGVPLQHSCMHAFLYPVRLYELVKAALGFARAESKFMKDYVHPYIGLFYNQLKLTDFLASLGK